MRRTIAALLILLLAAGAYSALVSAGAESSGASWAGLQRVDTGGGRGDYLALAERDGILAFLRFAGPENYETVSLGLYDLRASAPLAIREIPLPGSAYAQRLGFLDNGGLFLLDRDGMTLTHYDRALEETLRFAVPDPQRTTTCG